MTINLKNFLNDKNKMSKMGEFQNLKQIEGLEMSSVSADLLGGYSKPTENPSVPSFIHLDNNSVNFIGSLDYLHYHNICDDKLRKWGADIDSIDSYVNIDDGIYMACKSVIKNN